MELLLLAAEPATASVWAFGPIIIIAAVAFGVLMVGIAVAAVVAVIAGRRASP